MKEKQKIVKLSWYKSRVDTNLESAYRVLADIHYINKEYWEADYHYRNYRIKTKSIFEKIYKAMLAFDKLLSLKEDYRADLYNFKNALKEVEDTLQSALYHVDKTIYYFNNHKIYNAYLNGDKEVLACKK